MSNWGVLGCGTIGERRSSQLPEGVRITACFDVDFTRAQELAKKCGAKACPSLADFLSTPALDAVIIAAINSELVPLAQAALDKGLHVLIEKPAARSATELSRLKNPAGKIIKIGFNHRFHPAFISLTNELSSGADDPIMIIRAQYGNGARVGFEKEWRANVARAGGGELLDQGVHVLDLASVLLGDMDVMAGYVRTHFWNMPVDDNSWGILNARRNSATFTFHVSSSEWKNEFRFEVYTRKRKYQWLGLGRSYGTEKLIIHKMKPEMGMPDTEEREFSGPDESWKAENQNFHDAIMGKEAANGGISDAMRSLSLVEDIYRKSSQLQPQENHPQWWQEPK